MEHSTSNSAAPGGTAVTCDVLAHASVRLTPAQLPPLRQRPGPSAGEPLPSGFLKHADDQTVAGMAAVYQAIEKHGLTGTNFTDWGVLAAPRFLGRATLTVALQRFAAEGAWGISPHLIPHRSLHALSGTVSQALQIHGPNYGVGGGPGGAAEVILTAAALVSDRKVANAWVVLTGWFPEPRPDRSGQVPPDSLCQGVALALAATRPSWRGLRLRVTPCASGRTAGVGDFDLEALIAGLKLVEGTPATTAWHLPCGSRLELQRRGAGTEEAGRGWNGTAGAMHWPGQQIGAGTEKQR